MSDADEAGVAETLIYKPNSFFEPLVLERMFDIVRPLEVELGSGDGSFLVQYAQVNPDRNFLGVERLLGRLRKIDRKGRRASLSNLRVMRIEAGYFLEYLLPPTTVRTLHIYFPDPWPKRKHWKNRLVNERFTELARRVLEPGGAVCLRTDDSDYFTQMTSVFVANKNFNQTPMPPALNGFLTDFERDFHARGIATLAACYMLV